MSSEESEKPKASTPTPSVPSASDVQASLKKSIKSGVESANTALAGLQERADKVGQPLVKSLHTVQHEGAIVANKATELYTKRKQYGPEIIAGSSLLVGGIVGLRRGRVPAVVSGAATGFLTYVGVYELDLHRLPDVIFGQEDK